MTPEDIRRSYISVTDPGFGFNDSQARRAQIYFLREIAAQLAEFNGNFRMINGIEPASPRNPQEGEK